MEEAKVRIALNGEFSAPELEEIIRNLAEARAGTLPAVPMQPPSQLGADKQLLLQDEAEYAIRKLATGGLRIWLRNEGIGWLAFTLPKASADGLREFLSQQDGHSFTAH